MYRFEGDVLPGRILVSRLTWMLLVNMVLTAGICAALVMRDDTPSSAFAATAPGQIGSLLRPVWNDSWWPMLRACEYKAEPQGRDLYDLFFAEGVKYQYPPTALLFCDLVPKSEAGWVAAEGRNLTPPVTRFLTLLSQLAVLATIAASALIMKVAQEQASGGRKIPLWQLVSLIALSAALGLGYYPLVHAHALGQVQVLLNAAGALAILFYLRGWHAAAGACLGACALMKPQYGILLFWSYVRRRGKFALGFGIVVAIALGVSVTRFGLHDHLRYLDVLAFLSYHGESLYLNQSVNGLLQRLLLNGPATVPPGTLQSDFPPHHPFIYWATILSSLAILLFALWPLRRQARSDVGATDLMLVIAALTIAAPIAWDHHYGVFLPLFAAVTPWLLRIKPLGQATGPLLALSFASMSNVVLREKWFFETPTRGLLGSYLFFGGLLLFALLAAARATQWQGQGLVVAPDGGS